MRFLNFCIAIFILSLKVDAQPADYYSSATGLTGIALQQALHNIIKNHQVQSYASLYGHFQVTDCKPNMVVWDMYSDVPGGTPAYIYHYNAGDECGNYSREGDCYNREHSFPKSWFGGNIIPMYTDLFHLYPTDGYVNNRRANYPYGEVGSATWTSTNGSKVGSNTFSGYSGIVFEPVDEYKGDFARTYFYMAVRYYGQDGSWPGSPMHNGAQIKPWALNLLKTWHLQDSVSQKEINRNDVVYEIQGNRNPFIDHPEFAWAIWGGLTAIEELTEITGITVYPVPAIDHCFISFSEPITTLPASALFDPAGRQINISTSLDNGNIMIDTSDLPKGFYILAIQFENNYPIVAKIIK